MDKHTMALRQIAGFKLEQFAGPHHMAMECVNVAAGALAAAEAQPEPVARRVNVGNLWVGKTALQGQTAAPAPLTAREVELIDGMIQVQLHHAAQCDGIANRAMAEKQKAWDMERVELLRKLRAHGIKGAA